MGELLSACLMLYADALDEGFHASWCDREVSACLRAGHDEDFCAHFTGLLGVEARQLPPEPDALRNLRMPTEENIESDLFSGAVYP